MANENPVVQEDQGSDIQAQKPAGEQESNAGQAGLTEAEMLDLELDKRQKC
jgi:hypothetical protein